MPLSLLHNNTLNNGGSGYKVTDVNGVKYLNISGSVYEGDFINTGNYAVGTYYVPGSAYTSMGILNVTSSISQGGYSIFITSNWGGNYFGEQWVNSSAGSPVTNVQGSSTDASRYVDRTYNGSGSTSDFGIASPQNDLEGQIPSSAYYGTFSPTGSLQTLSSNAELSLFAGVLGANLYNYYLYAFVRSVPSTGMPTFSIGTGSVFQANASADNTTSQHYASFGADSVNLTDGEYTYSIPDSFNSNYITIYYNPNWQLNYASYKYTPGVQATSSGTMPYLTFAGVSGIGTLTMTFIEPLVIGQPLGTMAIGTAPSIAINGVGYFNLPTGEIDWFANGKYVNPSGFSVVVGKPITLTAKALGQTLNISTGGAFSPSITYTPTSVDTFLQTYLNMTEIQLNNYNSQYEVQVYAKGSETGGIWQLED